MCGECDTGSAQENGPASCVADVGRIVYGLCPRESVRDSSATSGLCAGVLAGLCRCGGNYVRALPRRACGLMLAIPCASTKHHVWGMRYGLCPRKWTGLVCGRCGENRVRALPTRERTGLVCDERALRRSARRLVPMWWELCTGTAQESVRSAQECSAACLRATRKPALGLRIACASLLACLLACVRACVLCVPCSLC